MTSRATLPNLSPLNNGGSYSLLLAGILCAAQAAEACTVPKTHGYDMVYCLHEGMAIAEKNHRFGFVDKNGKLVIALQYDTANDFSEGLAAVSKNKQFGFINKKGQAIIPLQYSWVNSFSESLAMVRQDDKYGFIDKKGKTAIPLQYDGADSFFYGMAVVQKDKRYGIIVIRDGRLLFYPYQLFSYAQINYATAVLHAATAPPAENPWRSIINPDKNVPAQGFDGYFFKRDHPQQVIFKTHSHDMGMSYTDQKELPGLPLQELSAYWIGKLDVSEDSVYRINLDLRGGDNLRILLDGRVIYDAEHPYQAAAIHKGTHTLEAEYTGNRFHDTISFWLALTPPRQILTLSQAQAALSKLPADMPVYAINVYESGNTDKHIDIQAPQTAPYILLLSSYEAVNWQIHGTAPAAVVMDGAREGSTISTAKHSAIYYIYSGFTYRENIYICKCDGDRFYCPGTAAPLSEMQKMSSEIFGRRLHGAEKRYSLKSITLPLPPITYAMLKAEQQQAAKIAAAKAKCERKKKPPKTKSK